MEACTGRAGGAAVRVAARAAEPAAAGQPAAVKGGGGAYLAPLHSRDKRWYILRLVSLAVRNDCPVEKVDLPVLLHELLHCLLRSEPVYQAWSESLSSCVTGPDRNVRLAGGTCARRGAAAAPAARTAGWPCSRRAGGCAWGAGRAPLRPSAAAAAATTPCGSPSVSAQPCTYIMSL